MVSTLEQLKQHTIVVIDTGDIDSIQKLGATDATTNPSLIFKAAQDPRYQSLVDDAIAYGLAKPDGKLDWISDRLLVNFGTEILKYIPGVVSTEVDARLSFKTERTVEKARRIIALYEEKGIPRERILIKIAATWQGIKAAEILEKEGIACNLTLIFSAEAQGVACAEAGVTLVSPFVGRIMDWYKKNTGIKGYSGEEDPGVLSVRSLYQYYKSYGYGTVVMGASFRNTDEIIALAGCDRLTIAPNLIEELGKLQTTVPRKLFPKIEIGRRRPTKLDDRHFYMRMCKDAMAIEMLHAGIRGFVADTEKLEHIIKAKASAKSGVSKL